MQDLTHRIDTYHGVTQGMAAELAAVKAQLTEMAAAGQSQKATTASTLANHKAAIGQLNTLLGKLQAASTSQGKSVGALNATLKVVSEKLENLIVTLRGKWFTGVK